MWASPAPLPLGKHSGRAALRAKLKDLGFDMVDNQLNDLFVRFKALADRKKEVFDDDLIALVTDAAAADQDRHLEVKFLRVICGTEAPQSADMTLTVVAPRTRPPRRATGRSMRPSTRSRRCFRKDAVLQLYQVQRGDRRHRRAGHGQRADGGGRQDRHRPVGGYRYRRRLGQGLCERLEPAAAAWCSISRRARPR
jgi:hypothetical protein